MRLTGGGAAPGFAVGPVWRPPSLVASGWGAAGARIGAGGADIDAASVGAIATAQLDEIADQLREAGRGDEAPPFEMQSRIAADSALLDAWQARMSAGVEPLAALEAAVEEASGALAGGGEADPAQRGAELLEVARRMRSIVTGEDLALPAEPSIVVADDLAEATVLEIPPGLILGIALEGGSPSSDAAVLARRLKLPCVVGVSGLLAAVDREFAAATGAGPEIAVDGIAGLVFTRPSEAELTAMHERRADYILSDEIARGARERPAQTRDGHRVRLLATINGPADVAAALEARAEGIGLFRTEYLFRGRQRPPTEDEQVAAYQEVFEAFAPDRPITVRLADAGAGTDVLGLHGIRLAYGDHSQLTTQIRAISRAASAANIEPRIAASMVATRADVDLLNELVRDAQAGLAADGLSATPHIATGIMVDVPSAAFMTRELAPRVDFFSIDAEGLAEHLLAADRANPALADLRDALHPAVMRAVRMVAGAAGAAEKAVSVCGDLAGDPAGALVLVGLGVDELSASADALDVLRYHLAAVSYEKLQILGARSLDAAEAADVRVLATELVDWRPSVAARGSGPA